MWTNVAFVMYSLGAIAHLAINIRVYSVFSAGISLGVIYLIYRYTVSRIGGLGMRHDLAQAYIACGIWLLPFALYILNALFLLISYVLVAELLQPFWYIRIGNAIGELSKHGELRIGGTKWKDLEALIMSKPKNPLKDVPIHALQVLCSPRQRAFTVASDFTTVIRGLVNAGNVANPKTTHRGIFAEEVETKLRSMVYEDGTKAGPLLGEVLRSFASIPFWFIIPLLFAIQVGVIFIGFNIFAMFVNNSLRRSNPTIRTVTACAMTLQLGTCALLLLTIAPNPYSVWEVTPFFLSIPLSLATAALIGMRLFDNSQTVFEEEKRPVILLPAALQLITSLTSLVCSLVILRQLLTITADVVELRINLDIAETLLAIFLVLLILAPSPVLLAVTIYAVRLAKGRFFSTSAS